VWHISVFDLLAAIARTQDEQALQSHITHLVNGANNVDPSGAITFSSAEANRLFQGAFLLKVTFLFTAPLLHLPLRFV
jgi:hypothetical protein